MGKWDGWELMRERGEKWEIIYSEIFRFISDSFLGSTCGNKLRKDSQKSKKRRKSSGTFFLYLS